MNPVIPNSRSTFSFDPEANTGLMLPYQMLSKALHESITFNQNEDPAQGEYLLKEFYDFADAVSSVPGYLGVFGTGHPFYALQSNNGVTYIPEIGRFIEQTIDRVAEDSWRFAGKWACGSCQVQNNLPDLKSQCKPCEIVDIKPRDMFKALPDLDFWVIVDQVDTATEKTIEQRTSTAGFYQSDKSIYRAVRDTAAVLTSLNAGQQPGARLPIDLHVVTEKEFSACLDKLNCLDVKSDSYEVPIQPRSLHVAWEQADEAYSFTHDFLFSLTEHGMSPELQERIIETRRILATKFTNGEIFHSIFNNDTKAARQLTNSTMMQILAARLNSWRDY